MAHRRDRIRKLFVLFRYRVDLILCPGALCALLFLRIDHSGEENDLAAQA